jgi:hypothetical protein
MQFDFMTFMASVATDADERASFLADPRAYLVASGLEVPSFFEVTAVEVETATPTMAFGVPSMLNMDELSEEALASIGGGGGCCFSCAT